MIPPLVRLVLTKVNLDHLSTIRAALKEPIRSLHRGTRALKARVGQSLADMQPQDKSRAVVLMQNHFHASFWCRTQEACGNHYQDPSVEAVSY